MIFWLLRLILEDKDSPTYIGSCIVPELPGTILTYSDVEVGSSDGVTILFQI